MAVMLLNGQLLLSGDDKSLIGGNYLDLSLRQTPGEDYEALRNSLSNWLSDTRSYWAEHDGSLVMGYYDDPFTDLKRAAGETAEGQSSFVQAAIGSSVGVVEHLPIIPLGICDIVTHSFRKVVERRDPLQLIINPVSMIASGMVDGGHYVMDQSVSWTGGSLDGRSSFEIGHEIASTLMIAGLIVMGLRGIGRGGKNFFDGMKGQSAAIASGMRPTPAYATVSSAGSGGLSIPKYGWGGGRPHATLGTVYMAAAKPGAGEMGTAGEIPTRAKGQVGKPSSRGDGGKDAFFAGSRSKPIVLKNQGQVYSVIIEGKEVPFQRMRDGKILAQPAGGDIVIDARGKVVFTGNRPAVLRGEDGVVLVVDKGVTNAVTIFDDVHVAVLRSDRNTYRCLDYEGNAVTGTADRAIIVKDPNVAADGIAFVGGRSGHGEFTNNGLFHYIMEGKHKACLPSGKRLNIADGEPLLLTTERAEFVLLDGSVSRAMIGDVDGAPGSLRLVTGKDGAITAYAQDGSFRFSRNKSSDGWQLKEYESFVYRRGGEDGLLIGFVRNRKFFEFEAEGGGVSFFRESKINVEKRQGVVAVDAQGKVVGKLASWSRTSILNNAAGEPVVITHGGHAYFIYPELTEGGVFYAKSVKYGAVPGATGGWKVFRVEDGGVPKALTRKEVSSRFENRLRDEGAPFKSDVLERPVSVEVLDSVDFTSKSEKGIVGWEDFETPVGIVRGGVASKRAIFTNATGKKHAITINYIKSYELPVGRKHTGRMAEDFHGEGGSGLVAPSSQKVISALSDMPWSALTRCERIVLQPIPRSLHIRALADYHNATRTMTFYSAMKRYSNLDIRPVLRHELGHSLQGDLTSLRRSSIEAMIIDGMRSDSYVWNSLRNDRYFMTDLKERFAEGVRVYLDRGPMMSSRAPRMTRLIEQRLAAAFAAGGNMSLALFLMGSLADDLPVDSTEVSDFEADLAGGDI
jgi:hypothetical protein